MSFISPALISRIYQALGRNKGCHAILLLRQHSFDTPPAHDNELMPLVVRMADQCLVEGDLSRAEDHYKLGLALYSSCFQDNCIDALRCISGLCSLYQTEGRSADLASAVTQLEQISNQVIAKKHVVKVAV
jgi:hypothetical protein